MEAAVKAGLSEEDDLGIYRVWGPQRAEAVELMSGAAMCPGPGSNHHF